MFCKPSNTPQLFPVVNTLLIDMNNSDVPPRLPLRLTGVTPIHLAFTGDLRAFGLSLDETNNSSSHQTNPICLTNTSTVYNATTIRQTPPGGRPSDSQTRPNISLDLFISARSHNERTPTVFHIFFFRIPRTFPGTVTT